MYNVKVQISWIQQLYEYKESNLIQTVGMGVLICL